MKRLIALLALVCLAASLPPLPPGAGKSRLRSPKDAGNQSGAPIRPGFPQAAQLPGWQVPLSYNLQPVDPYTQTTLETGISASTNQVNWSVVWFEPYPNATNMHVMVTLSNQPLRCYYRAFWRPKL